jgi:ribosomal protein S18 acetylase RimI-like enzyme
MTAQDNRLQFSVDVDITIRKATRRDVNRLEWHGEYAHFRRLFQRSYHEQEKGNRLMLVAVTNEFPIARLFIQMNGRNELIADGKRRAYLYSFHVMEMFQGRGIGSRLLHVADTLLRRRGFQSVTIAVAMDNPDALRLYQRRGFRIFAEDSGEWHYFDQHGERQDVHEPCWLLEKNLAPS